MFLDSDMSRYHVANLKRNTKDYNHPKIHPRSVAVTESRPCKLATLGCRLIGREGGVSGSTHFSDCVVGSGGPWAWVSTH